nr:helicase-exonuclease AddAB subunit AddA [Acetatifactor sp.]
GYIKNMLNGCVHKLEEVDRICDAPDGPYMYGELVEQELEQLRKVAELDSWEKLSAVVPAVSFGRLPSKKDESVSADKRELAKGLRDEVKKALQKITNQFFATPMELVLEQARACRKPVEALIDLVMEFDERMLAKKQEKKLIDFNDMEHYALNILLVRENGEIRPSHVAMEYRQFFHEILIDEYQDSNLVQEYLLRAVSGEEDGNFNRFLVGDVKQSIYKFRLARPELFLEKYKTYQQSGKLCRIDLSQNFRSRNTVVNTVNEIFARIMSEENGGLVYDDAAALHVGASYPDNPTCESELLLIDKPDDDSGMDAKEAEAAAIGQKIKDLCRNAKVTDKATGSLRPATYRDMVILLRTTSGWDDVFQKKLEEMGIPAYITAKTGYFSALEVQEILQFLRVLNNPRQDIPLFGVLKSVFGGFTEEEIAEIRSGQKQGCLFEAMQNYDGQDKLRTRISDFVSKLEEFRKKTVYLPIRELLENIVDSFDYLNYVTALPAGSKRRANVEMLFAKASDFEKTSYYGLFHFIRYIEQLEKYEVDYGEAGNLDENADVVRIMSIHKSKGLEFPITFVSGMSKKFNMQDTNQSLVVDMDMGLAVGYVDVKRRISNKTLRHAVISGKMKEDNLSEELRVLYVALTRAREKLIMTAVTDKAEEKWEQSCAVGAEKLAYIDFIEAGCYLDFILPILPNTSVETTVLQVQNLLAEEVNEQIRENVDIGRLSQAKSLADAEVYNRLKQQFAYQYPFQSLEKLYTKTTVSELKIAAMAEKDEAAYHRFEEKEVVPYIPHFKREEEQVSGATRGSAVHRLMELLPFDKMLSQLFESMPESFKEYRSKLPQESLEKHLKAFLVQEKEALRISEEYYRAVNIRKIVRFMNSEVAYRMWCADRRGELFKEQPFVYGVDAKRLLGELPTEEKVLIQGIIDVFFIENEKLVLLDYKTDVIESAEALWERYKTQLDAYQEALERLMDMPVLEKILYSFYLEEESVLYCGQQ